MLQTAVDGLFDALASWRTVAVLLTRLSDGEAQQEARAILRTIPQELRSAERGVPASWATDPARPRRACETAVRTLIELPANTPAVRLLADQTSKVLAGISDALNGLALLADSHVRPLASHRGFRLRVADWLPALINAGRAFIAIILAELFWIVTEWPNGAFAITFTAIGVLLFAPRADQAYATAKSFMIGNVLATVFTAIIAFAVLPGLETFEAFSLASGLYLIPVGALLARWQSAMFLAMAANFVPLLAPANEMSYNTEQFYNAALAIVAGSGVAAVSFRLLPPLPPAFRARRLLALTLLDLRRLATGRFAWPVRDWEGCMYGRLTALPDSAEPFSARSSWQPLRWVPKSFSSAASSPGSA